MDSIVKYLNLIFPLFEPKTDNNYLPEPQLTGPMSSGIVDVKVEGLKVSEDVFCELNRMEMTNRLRAVNSVAYPAFNVEKNVYEIIVKGDAGNRFEQQFYRDEKRECCQDQLHERNIRQGREGSGTDRRHRLLRRCCHRGGKLSV